MTETRAAKSGRREQRKAATRLAIIRAAIELAARDGYHHTTVEGIATRAGVSAATVFNYFPTKIDIYFADADLYTKVPPLTPGPSPHQTAAQAVLALARNGQWTLPLSDALTGAWFDLVQHEPDLAAHRVNLILGAAPHLAAALREIHPELDPVDAVAIAGAVLGACASVLTHTDGPVEERLLAAARTTTNR